MEGAPMPWWKQVLGYFGVCLLEAALGALLLFAHFTVIQPAVYGGGSGAVACGVIGLFFLAPIFWACFVLLFLAAKVVYVLTPASHRYLCLVLYWVVALAFIIQAVVKSHGRTHALGETLRDASFGTGLALIPALVLTLTHVALMTRIAPGVSAREALRSLLRRPARSHGETSRPSA